MAIAAPERMASQIWAADCEAEACSQCPIPCISGDPPVQQGIPLLYITG